MSKARVLIWIFSFHVLAVQGILLADESQEFNRSLISVYSFQPHTLTADEITAKSKELDKFWDMVEADPPRYLLLLRQALADATNPSFFFYDGSKLLLSLSSEREDQEIALQAIPRGDLRDIQHRDYLTTVAQLAHLGHDTSGAAFKILEEPEFQVIVPQHALTIGQDFALIYMLLPASEGYYVNKAADMLSEIGEPTAQKSLLRLLWYTVTDAGDRAIETVVKNDDFQSDVREMAKDLTAATSSLQREPKVPKKLRKAVKEFVPKGSDFARIKEIRRERLNRLSDEALYELDDLTMLLRIKRKNAK
jgi:hypothetical protein